MIKTIIAKPNLLPMIINFIGGLIIFIFILYFSIKLFKKLQSTK
ncbi:hypothetical protein [Tissierella sp. P1]|nr:hypothetical protein [Tissierella sp. P1]